MAEIKEPVPSSYPALSAASYRIPEASKEFFELLDASFELQMSLSTAKAIIRTCEWIEDSEYGVSSCPICGMDKPEGHKDDCVLSAFLADQHPSSKDDALADDIADAKREARFGESL